MQPRGIGTAKAKRLGIPKEWQKNDNRVRGETKIYETTFFGETMMYYTNWKDTQLVGILHTIPTYNGEVKRYVQERAADTGRLKWQRKLYARPTIIGDYNLNMGAVDSHDQREEAYRTSVKNCSWQP